LQHQVQIGMRDQIRPAYDVGVAGFSDVDALHNVPHVADIDLGGEHAHHFANEGLDRNSYDDAWFQGIRRKNDRAKIGLPSAGGGEKELRGVVSAGIRHRLADPRHAELFPSVEPDRENVAYCRHGLYEIAEIEGIVIVKRRLSSCRGGADNRTASATSST
jgi:hypothetical protein